LPPEASEHLEPNLSAQDAVDEQVINRLRGLAAEHAIIKICEAVPLALLRSPTSVLDHEPKKNLCSHGALIRYTSSAQHNAVCPWEKAAYAELVEYELVKVHFHITLLLAPGSSSTPPSTHALRWRYWTMAGMVRAPVIYLNQALLARASATVRRLQLSTVGVKSGAQTFECWDQPSALAGINHRLLLDSTVGSCWDRPSAFAGINRKLQGELC
jgi:hypothetical protein